MYIVSAQSLESSRPRFQDRQLGTLLKKSVVGQVGAVQSTGSLPGRAADDDADLEGKKAASPPELARSPECLHPPPDLQPVPECASGISPPLSSMRPALI